jgi:hypothetical protein
VGSARRAWRQKRGRFGERRPRLALVITGGILTGVTAVCAYQLGHGAYIGRGWVIAALAGMLTAAVLGATVLVRQRRHFGTLGRFEIGWLVLWPVAVSGLRFPFPVVPYGNVQAYFNVVHAALLGYEAVTSASFVAVLAVLFFHPRGLGGRAVLPRVARARTRRSPLGRQRERDSAGAAHRRAAAGTPTTCYTERRCGLRWPLVTWGSGVPAALTAALAWLIMSGSSHDTLAAVVSSLMGVGIVAALIGCGLLYRNWPTGIHIDESGVSIGAVGSARATARLPTVTHQNWGLFTCPWPRVRYVTVVTDPARIREIKKSPQYWTLSNRWGKPREMIWCMAGVLTAPFMKAALVIGVDHEEPGVVIPELRPVRFYSQTAGSSRVTADLAVEWVAPTRHPDRLRAFLATRNR